MEISVQAKQVHVLLFSVIHFNAGLFIFPFQGIWYAQIFGRYMDSGHEGETITRRQEGVDLCTDRFEVLVGAQLSRAQLTL